MPLHRSSGEMSSFPSAQCTLYLPTPLPVWTFHIKGSCVAHERRRRIFWQRCSSSSQTEHMCGNGKQLFHFLHLRCRSARRWLSKEAWEKTNELRESMKPEGREAFQSLSELPQNIAEHPESRTTESGTPHPGETIH